MIHYFSFLQPPDRFCLTAANYRLRNSKDSHQKSRPGGGGNIRNAGSGTPTYTIRPSGQTNTNRPPITMNQSTMPRLQLNTGKEAMKSSYLLDPFQMEEPQPWRKLMPCPFTGPKFFCDGPNFFEPTQKFNCIQRLFKKFCGGRKINSTEWKIIFLTGTKYLRLPQYVSKFLVWHKNLDQPKTFWDL